MDARRCRVSTFIDAGNQVVVGQRAPPARQGSRRRAWTRSCALWTVRDGKVVRGRSSATQPRPSKPPGFRSRRCRRRTWSRRRRLEAWTAATSSRACELVHPKSHPSRPASRSAGSEVLTEVARLWPGARREIWEALDALPSSRSANSSTPATELSVRSPGAARAAGASHAMSVTGMSFTFARARSFASAHSRIAPKPSKPPGCRSRRCRRRTWRSCGSARGVSTDALARCSECDLDVRSSGVP